MEPLTWTGIHAAYFTIPFGVLLSASIVSGVMLGGLSLIDSRPYRGLLFVGSLIVALAFVLAVSATFDFVTTGDLQAVLTSFHGWGKGLSKAVFLKLLTGTLMFPN